MSDERRCEWCDESLAGRRADAEVCGPECRRERSRVRRLLAGKGDGPYRSPRQYLDRLRRRAKPASGQSQPRADRARVDAGPASPYPVGNKAAPGGVVAPTEGLTKGECTPMADRNPMRDRAAFDPHGAKTAWLSKEVRLLLALNGEAA